MELGRSLAVVGLALLLIFQVTLGRWFICLGFIFPMGKEYWVLLSFFDSKILSLSKPQSSTRSTMSTSTRRPRLPASLSSSQGSESGGGDKSSGAFKVFTLQSGRKIRPVLGTTTEEAIHNLGRGGGNGLCWMPQERG